MRSAASTASALRCTTWLGAAALALHQLRYVAAGDEASLSHGGHGYLDALLPALVALALTLAAGALVSAASGRPWTARAHRSRATRAALFGTSLLLIFAGQELAEAAVRGQGPGLEIFAAGGWVAIPLAGVLGLALATVLSRLERLEQRLSARTSRARRVGRARTDRTAPPTAWLAPLVSLPLEFGLARRPPPPAPLR